MKNIEQWRPSKYEYKNNRLRGSRNPEEVGIGSRLITDLIADVYEENLRNNAKGRLLDLGCGKVPLYIAYKDFVAENICVDWANTRHKNPYLDYECDLTQPLPFEDASFDTIIFSDVLEHLPEPEKIWVEMSRVLSAGGRVIMNVPFYYWIHERPHDFFRYTEYALRRFIDSAGLKLLQLEPVGGAPEIMSDIFAKNIIRVPKVGYKLAMFSQWLTGSFVRTRFGKKVSGATKDNFPMMYFLVAEKP